MFFSVISLLLLQCGLFEGVDVGCKIFGLRLSSREKLSAKNFIMNYAKTTGWYAYVSPSF